MLTYLINLLPPLAKTGVMWLALVAACSFLFGFFSVAGSTAFYAIKRKITGDPFDID